ncbi:glycerate dehydrogenase [Rhizodiscina lignyota]|uniref:Glycerate dehydrogenase n=1 Tax=Rhizodiscina lignyota TaxID=1504668 RepID=A0A9P4M5F4_9PEZI|nr:glycerate dehydrogenase [Rhizodiscina lignyota]
MSSRQTHFKIVALETKFVPIPVIPFPTGYTYDLIEHSNTSADEIVSRIIDADIVIVTIARLTADILSPSATPKLKMIQVIGSGTDGVNLQACKARGVTVCSLVNGNAQSVAEHAVAGYFACRRGFGPSSEALRRGEWASTGMLARTLNDGDGMPPLTCREETVAMIGFGAIGERVSTLLGSLGMKIVVAERKGQDSIRNGRISFHQAIETASVVVLCLPRSSETLNLISVAEFKAMRRHALLINVSRGGIVDEAALLAALRDKQIAGAATDVFLTEPAEPSNSELLKPETRDLNLVVTPHIAWYAQETFKTFQEMIIENVVGWCVGKPKRVVV